MNAAPDSAIDVVAAVIERDGRWLVTRRLEGTHLAGLWEFPGGKCEAGETHEACLRRELMEELGLAAVVGDELVTTEHTYPEKTVRLHFRACRTSDDPRPLLGQEIRWVTHDELLALPLPDADREIVKAIAKR